MKGCRPLTDTEVRGTFRKLNGDRDRALFGLLLYTGWRITEVLSLKVSHIEKDRIRLPKRNTKGKIESRSSLIHPELRQLLDNYLIGAFLKPDDYLFKSTKSDKGISRIQAWRLIRPAMPSNVQGLGLHSFRKTFADKMYNSLDKDLVKTCYALGHKSVQNTVAYLSFKTEDVDAAIMTSFDKLLK